MPNPTTQELRKALNSDLKMTGNKGLEEVVNDLVRKNFTARVDGATLEFAHRQPDSAYWTGVKYYGSGSNSRIRIRRVAPLVVKAKTTAKRKSPKKAAAVETPALTAEAVS